VADPIVRPTSAPTDENGVITPGWTAWLNWVHQLVSACRQSGVTANRPTSGLWIGRMYYDTTLGYPVWVHSITAGVVVWHNGAGAAV
jgi:hypothetical protein